MEERTSKIAIEYLEHYKKVKYGMMPEWVWDTAIKALEQEPILDKIRAEIEESRWIDKDTRIVRNALASGLEKALEIIDKYKAESEDNNAEVN